MLRLMGAVAVLLASYYMPLAAGIIIKLKVGSEVLRVLLTLTFFFFRVVLYSETHKRYIKAMF